jgi:Ku protein
LQENAMSANGIADTAPTSIPADSAAPASRASWSGLLKISLVAVPVKAYPATTTSSETHFHQLHAGCGQRVRHEKHCPIHGKLDVGALAKGYEYAPGQCLALDEEQLDRLRPIQDRALCLERFLDAAQLDPALLAGRTLYLVPDGLAAQQPYLVLTQALAQRHKWALGVSVGLEVGHFVGQGQVWPTQVDVGHGEPPGRCRCSSFR